MTRSLGPYGGHDQKLLGQVLGVGEQTTWSLAF